MGQVLTGMFVQGPNDAFIMNGPSWIMWPVMHPSRLVASVATSNKALATQITSSFSFKVEGVIRKQVDWHLSHTSHY